MLSLFVSKIIKQFTVIDSNLIEPYSDIQAGHYFLHVRTIYIYVCVYMYTYVYVCIFIYKHT